MKILVTGGAGFIGSHIVDAYINLGHEVIVIDNLSTGQKRFLNPKAIFYQVDIRERAQVEEIFATHQPGVLNHHAAQMDVRKSVADPIFDAEVNILGLIHLMEIGRTTGLKQVIFASSGGTVYGEAKQIPTPESAPTLPISPYGISKLASENYLHFYRAIYGIKFAALRYGNVYGPRQNPHGEAGVVAIFCKKLLKQEQPVINGDGEQTRDFVYVKDVVEANVLALNLRQPLIVNIGTGTATSVNTVFDILGRLMQSTLPKKYGPVKPGEQRTSVLETSLAKETLSWSPKFTLERGLSETIAFFENES